MRSTPFPWPFFAIAYAFTWAVLSPAVLAQAGVIQLSPAAPGVLIAIAQFGASLAGFIAVYRRGGRAAAARLLKRAVDARMPIVWLAVALLLPVALTAVALLVSIAIGGAVPPLDLLSRPLLIVPYFVLTLLLMGPVPEEFGWRGYALDELQARWSALTASLVLGALWALWHLPLFFLAAAAQSSMPFWAFFVNTVAMTVVITWIYNSSGRKLVAALVFHTSANLAYALFPTVTPGGDVRAFIVLALINTLAAAMVVAVTGAERLVRAPQRLPSIVSA